MSFFAIAALINAITSLILGVFVLFKKRSRLNLAFSFFGLSVAFWSLSYFLWQIADNASDALFWCKVLTVWSVFIPLFYYRFTLIYLEIHSKKYNKFILYFSYLLAAFFVFISPGSLLVREVSERLIFKFWPVAGSLYWLFLTMFFGLAGYSVALFIKYYRSSLGINKQQIKFLLLGTGLGFLGGSTNFLLWYNIPILPLGNILVSLYVFFTAYAIIAHRLMDIKLVLRRSSVYIFSLTTVLALSVGLRYLLNRFLQINPDWLDLAILIAALYLFPPIRDYYYRLANKYFFSSLYDGRQVIAKLSDQLRSTLEIDRIYDSIAQSLINSLHIKNFGVLGYEKVVDQYFILYNVGFKVTPQQRFGGNHVLHRLFVSQSKTIVVEELKNAAFFDEVKDVYNLLTGLGVAALVPLSIKNEILGLLALGPKESGDMFNDEDLQMLETIASQSAVAIKNAQSYEETKNFSAKLQAEVARQTAALRQANEDLQKLDKAKSDFISIASHQLRTPLSIVKGYVSMILEGSYGAVAPPAREKLENIYESNERLNRLVDDLLDLSHMEGGKMKFDFAKVDFSAMAQSVAGELRPQAEKKNLKLIFESAKDNFFVKADEGKLRQVVFNLVDNAIKYTNEGNVTVSLGIIGEKIRLAVKDTGIGISRQDLENLFQKFIRGTNASHYHTEGVGIGLYVAKKMIEEHHGRVWAESDGDKQGSQFYIELPKWQGE
ncbi:MAG: Signal transduction histidine kinase [Parcubacteria group bacterium GW2011_GWA2_42_11]|nr:MAG: Signal transduction histidine kinase [Parcubacteria group bacterium GW2011_GWA2_42_11]KKT76452.1 MAG: Signal transduction histidine kinase [Parcubacteria group bacterium GW2011_GWF2_44_7]